MCLAPCGDLMVPMPAARGFTRGNRFDEQPVHWRPNGVPTMVQCAATIVVAT